MPTPIHLRGMVLISLLALSAFALSGCDKPTSAATSPGEPTEIIDNPNVLLTDTPSTDLSLQKRRLGDACQSSNQPFGEYVSFPYRYGVTNGKITSMVFAGDVVKSMDVEPTGIGLQMKLGKADLFEEEHDSITLYWFTKKRAAMVSDGQIKWIAVYK